MKTARGATSCALSLMSTEGDGGDYFIKELNTKLTIRAGVGMGGVTGMRVGTPNRWEFVLLGDPLRQATDAEHHAQPGEVVCSAEVWVAINDSFVGEPLEAGCWRVKEEAVSIRGQNYLVDEAVHAELLGHEITLDLGKIAPQAVRLPLVAFVHEAARESVRDGFTLVAERRSIVTAFCLIAGLEVALAQGVEGLQRIQECLEAAMDCIGRSGGLLRQFMLDDKGVICIWNFGLPSNVFEDSAARGMQSCFDVRDALDELGLASQIGLTAGSAFCGLVGSPHRCEYGVLGASVNLAARLMCKADADGMLCNDEFVQDFTTSKPTFTTGNLKFSITFEKLLPMAVKGYNTPVVIFRPVFDGLR